MKDHSFLFNNKEVKHAKTHQSVRTTHIPYIPVQILANVGGTRVYMKEYDIVSSFLFPVHIRIHKYTLQTKIILFSSKMPREKK